MTAMVGIYPRILVFTGVLAAFLLVLVMVPGSGEAYATTIENPIRTSATDGARKLSPGDCRPDNFAHTPTCTMQGRSIRVINF